VISKQPGALVIAHCGAVAVLLAVLVTKNPLGAENRSTENAWWSAAAMD
jgi:hypothetical protein